MFQKYALFIGDMLLKAFILSTGIIMLVATMKWWQLQSAAQFVANSMARYGCYTQVTEESLQEFGDRTFKDFDRGRLEVDIYPSYPEIAHYGEPVSVKITYPLQDAFDMGVMSYVFDHPLTATASGISTYIESYKPNSDGSPIEFTPVNPS